MPFHVWDHVLMCKRSESCDNLCIYCTKLYISDKKKSNYINKKLYADIDKLFPLLREGIPVAKKIQIFAHANIFVKKNGTNFGEFYYESATSPFTLWKFYLGVCCRIRFNVCEKFLLPDLVSGVSGNCRDFTACDIKNCSGMKVKKVKCIFNEDLAKFCCYFIQGLCDEVNPDFIHDVFNNYRGVDFFSSYLEFDRYE